MKSAVLGGVWAYMVVSVVAEVWAFYNVATAAAANAVIILLATSQAISIALFYMHLKDEPGSIRLFALIPLMFLAALLVAMMASLG